jgi:hypothetical protein
MDPHVAETLWKAIEGHLPPRPPDNHPPAATGCASRTGTASKGSSFGWPLAAPGTSQPGSAGQVKPPCAAGAPNGWPPAVFDKLVEEAIAGYGKTIAPGPVRGRRRRPACTKPRAVVKEPGPNPIDRAKIGWKWSVATDLFADPDRLGHRRSERNDSILLAPTLHLDRGYDSFLTTQHCQALGLTNVVCAKKKRKGEAKIKKTAHPRTALAR